jgi:hypothetical protein
VKALISSSTLRKVGGIRGLILDPGCITHNAAGRFPKPSTDYADSLE